MSPKGVSSEKIAKSPSIEITEDKELSKSGSKADKSSGARDSSSSRDKKQRRHSHTSTSEKKDKEKERSSRGKDS